VPAKRKRRDWLFAIRWVHVFEEDSGKGAVYRPEGDATPLSRRPRERIQLFEDGSASVFMPGPDDRLVEQQAAWRDDRGALVIRARGLAIEFRVVERSPSRLVVRVSRV
jgi:hypothetical protein